MLWYKLLMMNFYMEILDHALDIQAVLLYMHILKYLLRQNAKIYLQIAENSIN